MSPERHGETCGCPTASSRRSLAPSSHWSPLVRRTGTALSLALALLGWTTGCEPMLPPARDGGRDAEAHDGAAPAARARVVIPREALEAGDVAFESFTLRVASVRLVSDRGEGLDPVLTTVGPIDLTTSRELVFDSVPPASYSAAVLVLDGAATPLEIVAIDPGLGEVHLRYGSRLEWMARCSAGIPVRVGETLTLGIELELSSAWEELREATLPAPSGGIITIDERSAPAVLEAFVAAVGATVRAECDRE